VSEHTGIGWCDHTFNIAWGCMKVSPGCHHCYAETLARRRHGTRIWGPPATTARKLNSAKYWVDPLRWDRKAEAEGVRRRVFSSSMCDNFEDHPTIIAELAKLWPLIRATPWLDWQLLTKRPERIAESLPDDWGNGYPNVWLGTSVENQDYVWRLEALARVPATIRFISFEPLLGAIEPPDELLEAFHWMIVGGESGPIRRPMRVEWLESLVAQCHTEGLAVYVKQDWGPRDGMQGRIPDDMWALKEFPRASVSA
jgi:protein gp37